MAINKRDYYEVLGVTRDADDKGVKKAFRSLARELHPGKRNSLDALCERYQIDNAHRLSLRYVLSFGVDKAAEYDHYYRVMANAASYAEEHGIALAMKPHGGASGASEEILRCIEKVKHRNFKIWYDAGNIIYYTGKDPLTELEPVAQYVTGFCAKDCAEQKGNVMIQFGAGKVDFGAIFRKLKSAGFDGPIMVECCALASTPQEVAVNARRNREFLERALPAS